MFSEKADKTVNACRFCWMCRHICPVGLATGKESNTPRAKALMISMTEKGIDLKRPAAREGAAGRRPVARGWEPLR